MLLLNGPNLPADSHGVEFKDATAEAGINFRHVNGAKGNYHLPETIGSGGALFDYDTDGDLDLYLVKQRGFDRRGFRECVHKHSVSQ